MKNAATVEDLIKFLKKNFNEDDKLCFWHEGGAWIECEYVNKSDLGKLFLRRLSDEKNDRWKGLTLLDKTYPKDKFEYDYRLIDKPKDYVLIY